MKYNSKGWFVFTMKRPTKKKTKGSDGVSYSRRKVKRLQILRRKRENDLVIQFKYYISTNLSARGIVQ